MAKQRTNNPGGRRKDRSAAPAAPVVPPTRGSPWKAIAIVVIGGVAIAGAVVLETQRSKPGAVAPMPRGPANLPAPMIQQEGSAQSFPQPPGEAPAGQVWSTSHGHWHDAVTGQAAQ